MRIVLPAALVAALMLSACGSNEPTRVGYGEAPSIPPTAEGYSEGPILPPSGPTAEGYSEGLTGLFVPKVCK